MEFSKNQNKVAAEMVNLISNAIGQNKVVHLATAIKTSARLSGSFLLRSFNFDLEDVKPVTALLSNEANEEGPLLINVIGTVLTNLNVPIDDAKMDSAAIEESQLDFIESLKATQKDAHKLKETYKLTDKEMAVSCAVTTAFIIEEAKNDLGVEVAFNTAIYGLIEGTKTMPPAMEGTSGETASKPKPPTKPKSKKWYEFWK